MRKENEASVAQLPVEPVNTEVNSEIVSPEPRKPYDNRMFGNNMSPPPTKKGISPPPRTSAPTPT